MQSNDTEGPPLDIPDSNPLPIFLPKGGPYDNGKWGWFKKNSEGLLEPIPRSRPGSQHPEADMRDTHSYHPVSNRNKYASQSVKDSAWVQDKSWLLTVNPTKKTRSITDE